VHCFVPFAGIVHFSSFQAPFRPQDCPLPVSGLRIVHSRSHIYKATQNNQSSVEWKCSEERIALLTDYTKIIHANSLGESPGYDNNLPFSCTGHQISRIKSSYELFCIKIWNLSHFLPKFEFSLIQNSVSGSFSHVFHHWQELFRQLFRHYNHKSELWWSVPHVRLHIMS